MDLLVAALAALAVVAVVFMALGSFVAYAPALGRWLACWFERVAQSVLEPLRAHVGGGWAAYGYASRWMKQKSEPPPSRPR